MPAISGPTTVFLLGSWSVSSPPVSAWPLDMLAYLGCFTSSRKPTSQVTTASLVCADTVAAGCPAGVLLSGCGGIHSGRLPCNPRGPLPRSRSVTLAKLLCLPKQLPLQGGDSGPQLGGLECRCHPCCVGELCPAPPPFFVITL